MNSGLVSEAQFGVSGPFLLTFKSPAVTAVMGFRLSLCFWSPENRLFLPSPYSISQVSYLPYPVVSVNGVSQWGFQSFIHSFMYWFIERDEAASLHWNIFLFWMGIMQFVWDFARENGNPGVPLSAVYRSCLGSTNKVFDLNCFKPQQSVD